jgi:hypothetical protein
LTSVVTEKVGVREYFCGMYPSVQFLLGNGVPDSEGATIHSIVPVSPDPIDDNKIGFTLDVAVRLDQELSENARPGVIVPLVEDPELADTA